VHAYCRRRSNVDSADDLVADVFLTVWRKIRDAPDGEDALPWLYRIAYLKVTNHWREANRRKKLDEQLESIGIEPASLIQDQV
jgi:RNA polymerase sigma-70 factor (ECF subfamily)